jgi:hypothetical protein
MTEPHERVLEEMLADASRDPVNRPVFIRALIDSPIYVLGAQDDPDPTQITSFVDAEGTVIPMFTSVDMLRRTADVLELHAPSALCMPCRSLWEAASHERFVLNPHGDHLRVFYADEIQALLAGREPGLHEVEIIEPVSLSVGVPTNVPAGMVDVLTRFFSARPTIEARLGWVRFPNGDECFLVTVATDDPDEAIRGFGSLGVEGITGGVRVDVIVEPAAEAGLVLPVVEPFYVSA